MDRVSPHSAAGEVIALNEAFCFCTQFHVKILSKQNELEKGRWKLLFFSQTF